MAANLNLALILGHPIKANSNDVGCNLTNCKEIFVVPVGSVIFVCPKIKTSTEGLFQKQSKYGWPSLIIKKNFDYEERHRNHTKQLQYGDKIRIFNNFTKNIVDFQLPNSLATQTCLMKEEVRFLNDFASNCNLNYIEEDNLLLSVETYFKNLTVLTSPENFNLTNLERRNMTCPKNTCLPIEPEICDEFFVNCVNLSKINKEIKPLCKVNIYNDEINCINLVRKVNYSFHHNGSDGIKRVVVKINLSAFLHKLSEEKVNFRQEFNVKFLWTNRTITYSDLRSGNPGYLTGRPILVANLIINETFVNNTKENITERILKKNLTRNPHDFADNFLTLPISNKDGFCVLNNNTNNPIEFNIDSIHKCKFQSTVKLNKTKRANETCQSIQRIIFNYWFVSTKNTTLKLIGDFGNADVKKIDDWSSILFYREPNEILSNITGHYSSKNTTITCYNLTSNLKIDIFHARVVYKNLDNQEKIVGTLYDLIHLNNVTFNILNEEILLDISIRHEVMFFDITARKVKKYTDPPSFELKLPHDFFYPFVKLNGANKISDFNVNILTIIIVFLII